MVQPDRPHRMPGDTQMHDLCSTVCTLASLCRCTMSERANRFILHLSAYVMHCQLPNSKASRGVVCSLSLLTSGLADARPAWHRLHTGIVVWVHYPRRLELLLRRSWCIASSLAPKHRMGQPVRPHRRLGDT